MSETSTKPYLLRAIHEWCTDNGYTPYLAAMVDSHTMVPMQFVKNGEIVLNIGFNATSGLKMENDAIHFSARFGGVARDIYVPVNNVIAIYASENGQGMAFEVAENTPARDIGERDAAGFNPVSVPVLTAVPESAESDAFGASAEDDAGNHPPPPKNGKRPTLTRIK